MLLGNRTLSTLATILLALAVPARAGEPAVDDLLAKMPAQSVQEGHALAAELAKRGPQAIRAVCAKVTDPAQGGDLKANAQARYALHALATWCSRPDAEAERQALATVLAGVMAAERNLEVKKFLIRQLQLAGQDPAVAPLAKLLGHDELCEPATQALLAIGTPAATEALVQALPGATGARRTTLLRALGRLRAKAAVPEILKDADAKDRPHRLVALYALANIGDPAAGTVLTKAAQAKGTYERAKATSFLLLFARRLAESGHKEPAARICRELVQQRTGAQERHVACAALRVLAQALGADALKDLMSALEHPDKEVRAAAVRVAEALPGEGVTAALGGHLKQAPPGMRVRIVEALGRRGDRTALPAVLDALKDAEKSVRLAAIAAAATLGGKDVLAPLLARLETDQVDEVQAIERVVVALPGEEVSAAVAKALDGAPAPVRVALLDILAARVARGHLEAVLNATADPDANVRVAAVQALAVLGTPAVMPRLVALLLKAESSRERTTLQRVLATLGERVPDRAQRAQPVLAALPATEGEPRVLLLQALTRLGGPKALDAVVADTKSQNAAVQNGAIRALAEWPDATAAPELLRIARTAEKLPHKVIALRGTIRIVGEAGGLSAAQKVEKLQAALAAAPRPEEKKLVLGGLAAIRSVHSLQAVAACLDEEALAHEAAAAAVRIACPKNRRDKGLRGPQVAEVLRKVLQATDNADVLAKARAHLKTIAPPPGKAKP